MSVLLKCWMVFLFGSFFVTVLIQNAVLYRLRRQEGGWRAVYRRSWWDLYWREPTPLQRKLMWPGLIAFFLTWTTGMLLGLIREFVEPSGFFHQLLPPIFIVGTLFAVIACYVLWVRVKLLLRERGYATSFYYAHSRDFGEMRKLIRAEKDPVLRRRYALLLRWYCISLGIMICFGVGLLCVMGNGK